MKLSTSTAALFVLAAGLSADVLVVAPTLGPGIDHTSIFTAVKAASEGDTILVHDGTYDRFVIDGKSLDVIALGDGAYLKSTTQLTTSNAPAMPTAWIINLAADQSVLVQGFTSNIGVRVDFCEGPVWFDQHVVEGFPSLAACMSQPNAGGEVGHSANVTFTNCRLVGERGNQIWYVVDPGAGVYARFSTVQLYGCSIVGGGGNPFTYMTAVTGAAGLKIKESDVLVSGCSIEGGPGGTTTGATCGSTPAAGGPGVEFETTGGTLHAAATTAVGGFLDLTALCPGMTGPVGPAIEGSGTVVSLPGYYRELVANNPVRGGETLTFDVAGQPGETPIVLLSSDHAPVLLTNYAGALLVGHPLADLFVLPSLQASGRESLSMVVPNVGLPVGAVSFYAQACFFDPLGQVWLGSGTTVTLLDGSF